MKMIDDVIDSVTTLLRTKQRISVTGIRMIRCVVTRKNRMKNEY